MRYFYEGDCNQVSMHGWFHGHAYTDRFPWWALYCMISLPNIFALDKVCIAQGVLRVFLGDHPTLCLPVGWQGVKRCGEGMS